MDKKQIQAQLRSSLEFKTLWNYFIVTAVILSLFALFAVLQNSGTWWGVAAAIYGLLLAPYLIFCIIRNDVDKQVNITVSNAKAEAAKLEAEGEAEYMRLLAAAYNSNDKKEFYEFTLALDALKQSLDGDEKTVILDANSELAQILMGAN